MKGGREQTLDWEQEYGFLSQLCQYVVVTISQAFHLYKSWFPFCKMGCLNQTNFVLFSHICKASCSQSPSSHSPRHPLPSRLHLLRLNNLQAHSWFLLCFAPQAYGVLGSPFHLPASYGPCRLNTSLSHCEKFSLTISVFPNLTILLERYCSMCIYNTS